MSGEYESLHFVDLEPTAGDSRYISLHFAVAPSNIDATGWETTLWGTGAVRNQREYLSPAGLDATQWGTGVVTAPTFIAPQPRGWDALAFGGAGIRYYNSNLQQAGIASFVGGTQFVSLFNREINLAGRGMASDAFGVSTLSDSPRTLRPRVVSTLVFGLASFGTTRSITGGPGFEATEFGATDAWDKRQPADVDPWDATQWGMANIELHTQQVWPGNFLYQQDYINFGGVSTRKTRHYIEQAFQIGPYDGGVFGAYHGVRNRNTAYDVQGFVSARLGTPAIELGADALAVAAFADQTEWAAGSFVAHYTRSISAQGMQTDRHPNYTSLRNAAYAPLPRGWDSASVPAPGVVNRATFYPVPSIGDTSSFGTPWVSRSPRTLDAHREGIWGTQFGRLITGYRLQYIGPTAPTSNPIFGAFAQVTEVFTILEPELFAEQSLVSTGARLRNVTPEITPVLIESEDWGAAAVRTAFRTLQPGSVTATQFPPWFPNVAYRTKRIGVGSISAFGMRDLHLVELATPNVPAPHMVSGVRIGSSVTPGNPLWHASGIGTPTVRENEIEHSGWDSLNAGSPTAYSNVLRPPQMSPDPEQVGYPSLSPRHSTVRVPEQEHTQFGEPRMSPWYIWAPRGYPFGADRGQAIDEDETDGGGPIWGAPGVANRTRYLGHEHPFNPVFGVVEEPGIALRAQHIRPTTFTTGRYGFPSVPGENYVDPLGFDNDAFGDIDLTDVQALVRYLRPASMAATELGGLERIHLFTRYPEATGFDAFLEGSASIAREFDPFLMDGFEATVFGGDGFIDYRIRARQFEGFDAEEMEYSEGAFSQRARIGHYPPLVRGPQADGFEATEFGAPLTGNRVRAVQAWQMYAFQPGYPGVA